MNNLKVAGYGRVSTPFQALEGTSKEDQKEKIVEECKKRKLELYDFYSDFGFSGKNRRRPGLQRLLEDAKLNKFKIVMLTKLDRLGRNLRDLNNILYELRNNLGLEIIFTEQPELNSSGTYGNVLLVLMGLFAELEGILILERMGAGRNIKRQKGTAFMGQPPFGYKWDKKEKKITIDDKEKEICLKIVSMYLDLHFSMREIAEKLSSEGIPPPSISAKNWTRNQAKKWNTVSIRKILTNLAYTGETFHNCNVYETAISKSGNPYTFSGKAKKPQDKWVLMKFEPIIKKREWALIQARIQSQKRKSKRVYKADLQHL